MKRPVGALCVTLVLAAVAVSPGPAGVVDSTPTHAVSPAGSAGMVVAVDPVTGEFREPTAEDYAGLQAQSVVDFNTSDFGLTEELNTGPGGGYRLDHKGRFQNSMSMTIDASGQIHSSCGSPVPAAPPAPKAVK